MAIYKLNHFFSFSGSKTLNSFYQHTLYSLKIKKMIGPLLPNEIATAIQLVYFEGGQLTFFVETGAIAAKLNFYIPRLLAKLKKLDNAIAKIQIKVQKVRPLVRPTHSKQHIISPSALKTLEASYVDLPESALKAAMARLIRRHSENNN